MLNSAKIQRKHVVAAFISLVEVHHRSCPVRTTASEIHHDCFTLCLSKRSEGVKNNGPLYLQIINRPKIIHCLRMGQNTIGNIISIKSMASNSLNTVKRLHSMRKTLVQKLKKSDQPRHIIKEITGHAK